MTNSVGCKTKHPNPWQCPWDPEGIPKGNVGTMCQHPFYVHSGLFNFFHWSNNLHTNVFIHLKHSYKDTLSNGLSQQQRGYLILEKTLEHQLIACR